MNETLLQALQTQFNYERTNAAFYQALADTLAGMQWKGCAHWFEKQAAEEAQHARRFAKFLLAHGCIPRHDVLEALAFVPGAVGDADQGKSSPAWAFLDALLREQDTTTQIHMLYHLAEQELDLPTQQFLHWYIQEQVEELEVLLNILQDFGRANDAASRLILDREYGNR